MGKLIRLFYVIVMIITIMVVAGCSSGNEKMLREYAGTYVGDASTVSALVKDLMGGETFDGLNLEDQILRVNYTNDREDAEDWFEGDRLERQFLFNAIYLSLLVPNAEAIEFQLEDYHFSVPQEAMSDISASVLVGYPDEEAIWDEEEVSKFLERNQEDIIELVRAGEFRRSFYDRFPITKG